MTALERNNECSMSVAVDTSKVGTAAYRQGIVLPERGLTCCPHVATHNNPFTPSCNSQKAPHSHCFSLSVR